VYVCTVCDDGLQGLSKAIHDPLQSDIYIKASNRIAGNFFQHHSIVVLCHPTNFSSSFLQCKEELDALLTQYAQYKIIKEIKCLTGKWLPPEKNKIFPSDLSAFLRIHTHQQIHQ
jgi:hypothetical protein